jgi:hypothetical protein
MVGSLPRFAANDSTARVPGAAAEVPGPGLCGLRVRTDGKQFAMGSKRFHLRGVTYDPMWLYEYEPYVNVVALPANASVEATIGDATLVPPKTSQPL